MNDEIVGRVASIVKGYRPGQPQAIAGALRECWLLFAPNRGVELIKAELREQVEVAGTPIPALQALGKEVARAARKDVDGFLPLARLLWDEYGREGRVIALIALGAMELAEPERLVPLLRELCRGCLSWEDADRLAMDALEPIVRKYPDKWLAEMAAWLDDPSKWVRRAAITVIGRLPMKHPAYTRQCLVLAERLLLDGELDVKRAVSFAIRLCARADPGLVREFLTGQVPAADPAAVWVLCDVIKSMGRKLLPEFAPLLPRYQAWRAAPRVSSKDQRSIDSAIKVLSEL